MSATRCATCATRWSRSWSTKFIPERAYAEQWDMEGLADAVKAQLGLDLPVQDWAKEEGIADEEIVERLTKAADEHMAKKASRFGPEIMRAVEKQVLLQTLDHLWREHLATLDHLRSVVGFRGYAQRDPLNEYKTEGFELFQTLLTSLRRAVTGQLSHVEMQQRPAPPPPRRWAWRITSIRRPARTRWRERAPRQRLPPSALRLSAGATRRTRRPGARSAATRPVPAVPARSTSSVMGRWWPEARPRFMAVEIRRLRSADAAVLDRVADGVFDEPVVPERVADLSRRARPHHAGAWLTARSSRNAQRSSTTHPDK